MQICSINVRYECYYALPLLLLTILQLHHPPPLLPPPINNSSCLFIHCSPYMLAIGLYYCTFQGVYCKIKNVSFIFCVCVLCEKYY